MPTFCKPITANPSLFTEIVRTTLDVDPVLFFYGTAAVALTVFWVVGTLTFGRSRTA